MIWGYLGTPILGNLHMYANDVIKNDVRHIRTLKESKVACRRIHH